MFDKQEPKVDKFVFNVSTQEKNFCDCFAYEPMNQSEERLGSLYMLGEIKDVSEDSFFILNHIATLIKRNYYSQTAKPCLMALEETLKKVNEGMQELISQKKTEWIGKLHFIVGILSQNTLYFTLCGNPRLFFVRSGEVTDVGEKIGVGVKEIIPHKIFRSVASGKVEKGDKVLMLTSDVFYSISRENWTEITKSHNPARKIKELCSSQRLTIVHNGGALVISLAHDEKEEKQIFMPAPQMPEKAPKAFYEERLSKKKRIFITLKRILKFLYVILRFIIKTLIYLLKWGGVLLKRFAKWFWTVLKKIHFFQKLEEKFKALPQNPVFQKINALIKFFRKKIVFIPFIFLLLALTVFAGIQYQKREVKLSEWKEILEEAKAKHKEGEIAIIYGAKEKAIKSFEEAETLVLKVEKSGYLKKEAGGIRESTMSKLQKLLNIEIIEKPEILATLGSFSIKFDIQKIVLTDDESMLFASDPSSALFYKFNLAEKKGEFSLAPIPEGGVSKMASLEAGQNPTIFFALPQSIFFYLPQEKKFSESQTLNSPYEDAEFQDLASYKNNIYFLDSKDGEIVKFVFDPEKNELSQGKIWLSRKTKKPQNAKSFACDGGIWALNEKGEILKFNNGYFIQKLETASNFEGATKIWTSSNHPFLYVLDPPKKRITILNKKGGVEKQYFSEKFDNLKDFWVSKNGNAIYLLNGNQIFIVKAKS